MAQTVGDVMTRNPQTIEATQPVTLAARQMRAADAGDVIVTDNGGVVGIVTDRDIAVRLVAEGRDPNSTPVREVCSATDIATIGPDTSISQAARLMSDKAVRRLPVMSNGKAVGVVSIGDLAIERDPDSALGNISAAPGNT